MIGDGQPGGAYILYGADDGINDYLKDWEQDNQPVSFLMYGENQGIGIKEAREINRKGRILPARGYQAFIVSRADQMTYEAASALLKFVEELPTRTFIFFLARSIDSVLPTIRSRAAAIPFVRAQKSGLNTYKKTPATLTDIKEIENVDQAILCIDGILNMLRDRIYQSVQNKHGGDLKKVLLDVRSGLDCHAKLLYSGGSRKILLESFIIKI